MNSSIMVEHHNIRFTEQFHPTLRILISFFIIIFILFHAPVIPSVHADISLDGSMGSSGALGGPDYTIGHDLGRLQGTNLFHSFSRFNVMTGESATFTGPNAIENVIGRVTGGASSSIDGLLRSTIQDANLFLINPSGVMFGPNATLDVNGSFHVSTADYLNLSDGGVFYADPARNSVLTVAPPSAFGFLGDSPAAITIDGSSLQVSEGETLSIVGGDIRISGGGLNAPEGRINIAGVASEGRVIPNESIQTPDLNVDGFEKLGQIDIQNNAAIDTSGSPAGTVVIRGGRFQIQDSSIESNSFGIDSAGKISLQANAVTIEGSTIRSDTGDGSGGDIHIKAETCEITKDAGVFSITWDKGAGGRVTIEAEDALIENSRVTTDAYAEGSGGDILLKTETLSIENNSYIHTSAGGPGSGGDVTITAKDLIVDDSLINTGTLGGPAGDVRVDVSTVAVINGGSISTSGDISQPSGNIAITATDEISISTAPTTLFLASSVYSSNFSGGDAGSIFVSTPRLNIDTGSIYSSSWDGQAGDVTIVAAHEMSVSRPPDAVFGSYISSSSTNGKGGTISITTPELTLDNSRLGTSPSETASAGHILLDVGSLTLINGASLNSSTYGAGQGGNITVSASEDITIHSESLIFRSGIFGYTGGSGDAGTIHVSTPNLTINGGAISAFTLEEQGGAAGEIHLNVGKISLTGGAEIASDTYVDGQGGSVSIVASDGVTISGGSESGLIKSHISCATNGSGKGGDVSISTPVLRIDEGYISASTFGGGNAGSIRLDLDNLTLTNGAQIHTASVGAGHGGYLQVIASDTVTITGISSDGGISSALLSGAYGTGQGGDIDIEAGQIYISDGAGISAESTGPGNAGTIDIAFKNTFLLNEGYVVTSADQADGGNIRINPGRTLYLADGEISAEVGGGPETSGGNIFIELDYVALNDSRIVANAYEGKGGNILIVAGTYLSDPNSVVSASSALGIHGTVDIEAPEVNIIDVQVPLPKVVFSAADLLQNPCIARLKAGEASSFIISGRDGLPIMPGKLLPSPVFQEKIAEKEKRDSF